MNVTTEAAQVGQMLLQALQNLVGLGPDEALDQAKADTGVTDAQIEHADMGEVFGYMCGQPGLDPHLQGFLTNQANQWNSYGNVNQGGSSYSGGGGGWSGGGSSGGGAATNQQIVQQVTQNYNYQEINDNSIDILGPVNGDIDIDQDNDDVDVNGDGNAVNTGEGDQNAVTGDHSSGAQSNGSGDATSNSGDGAVVAGDDVDIDGNVNTGTFTGVQNDSGTVDDAVVGDGNHVIDLEGSTNVGSALGFGEGDTGNMVGNYLEEGAGASATGDATGQSVDTNVQSDVNEEHGPGDQGAGLHDGGGIRVPLGHDPAPARELGQDDDGGHHGGHGHGPEISDNFSPDVDVNVEGGDGDQHVHEDDVADA